MNRRNIALTALAVAAGLTVLFAMSEAMNRNEILGIFYFPAIFIAVVLSGGKHAPTAVTGWSSFVVYTVFYWAVFFVVYAVLLELWLSRRSALHLREASRTLTAEGRNGESREALGALGRAIKEFETRRRRHFFLKSTTAIDLSQEDHQLGAQAIVALRNQRPVKVMLRRFEKELAGRVGKQEAARRLQRLHELARNTQSA